MDSLSSPASLISPAVSTPSPPPIDSIRRAPINLNHWYVVAQSSELTDQPLGVVLWHQPIVLYRDRNQVIHALEDRCPHRQVRLSHGQVHGNQLECVYHGWQFNGAGACVEVPYLSAKQKLPSCRLRTYPVKEQDGFIWLFPGDADQADTLAPMGLPEWDHINYIASYTTIDTPSHFSFLIENLMDMYHGRLHDNLQAWANPVLRDIETSPTRVDAHYDAESYYKIDKIYSVGQLFIPAMRKLRPTNLDVSYVYPHWQSVLGNDFKIYCLFCPVSETQTKAYLVHFVSLGAFHRLHKLPMGFRRFVKNSLFNAARGLLAGLVVQDVLMMEDEQRAFEAMPHRKGPEFNQTIVKVQQLIDYQAQQS
ncbi:aromatic ring-hydroxylating dioxygenase subunit alpha [Leptothoe sp. ISB3NOV94-8A]|uniref:aromatic ring-hydroxylating dioxygenase subunit alpha n=1 Tax=Adonisia turfae TaxID=2950184 RepID=UPI00202994C5|nr:aromatic ring-hydroxylating dioxygenase subunit alpha [Adonisia turfae]